MIVEFLETALTNDFGGYSANYRPWWNIFGNDCPTGDNGTFANGDTRHDGNSGTNKDVVTNGDGLLNGSHISGVNIVFLVVNHDFRGDVNVRANG